MANTAEAPVELLQEGGGLGAALFSWRGRGKDYHSGSLTAQQVKIHSFVLRVCVRSACSTCWWSEGTAGECFVMYLDVMCFLCSDYA